MNALSLFTSANLTACRYHYRSTQNKLGSQAICNTFCIRWIVDSLGQAFCVVWVGHTESLSEAISYVSIHILTGRKLTLSKAVDESFMLRYIHLQVALETICSKSVQWIYCQSGATTKSDQ